MVSSPCRPASAAARVLPVSERGTDAKSQTPACHRLLPQMCALHCRAGRPALLLLMTPPLSPAALRLGQLSPAAGSALLQQTVQVVPSDSPAARVAEARVMRASFPPPGLMAMPLFGGGPFPHGGQYRAGRRGGRGGRGGRSGRGRGRGSREPASFRYVRPTGEPGAGAGGSSSAAAATTMTE
jgi:hypothetical protein